MTDIEIMKTRYVAIGFSILAFIVIYFAALPFIGGFIFSYPTNDRDNADPKMRTEMIQRTLDWGRLAPFPKSAQDFHIRTEGNTFTRTFRGSFSDSPEIIDAWLQSSPGVREGQKDDTTIILKTGEGASYGEIIISPDGSRIDFRVSWS